MSEHEYQELWHYSEQFTKDKLQRSELVTMAWKEGQRLGDRCSPGLMKSMMHFRAKELKKRSAFPSDEMGKSQSDAWNHERVYVDRKAYCDGTTTILADLLLPMKITPLNFTIAHDFMDALTEEERIFIDDSLAGYSLKDISRRNQFSNTRLSTLRLSVQEKAIAYL